MFHKIVAVLVRSSLFLLLVSAQPFSEDANGTCDDAAQCDDAAGEEVVTDPSNSHRPVPVLIDPLEILKSMGEDSDKWELNEHGVPKVMRNYAVSEDPLMIVVPRFLSDNEMEHLIEISEAGWERSKVGLNSGDSNALETDDSAFERKEDSSRTSYSNFLQYEQTPTVKYIEERLASLTGIPVDYIEPLAMVRYSPGEVFNEHHDGGFRQKTVFIYLNDLPEGDGGETLFPELGLKFVPRRGCAVMWSNNVAGGLLGAEEPSMRMLHQGLPPNTATKYGVNVFFNVKPIRNQIMTDDNVEQGEVASLPLDSPLYVLLDARTMQESSGSPPSGDMMSFQIYQDPHVVLVPELLSLEEAAAVLAAGSAPVLSEQPAERAALLEQAWSRVAALSGRHVDTMHSWISTFATGSTAEGPSAAVQGIGWKIVYVFLSDEFDGGELLFPGIYAKIRPRAGCGVSFATHSNEGQPQPRTAYTSLPPSLGMKHVAIFSFGYQLPMVERE